jgi:hypothetical protein
MRLNGVNNESDLRLAAAIRRTAVPSAHLRRRAEFLQLFACAFVAELERFPEICDGPVPVPFRGTLCRDRTTKRPRSCA